MSPPRPNRYGKNEPRENVALASSDQGSGKAFAGFLCGLGSLSAALLAGLFISGALPGRSISEGLLLLIATIPLALIGFGLSVRGRHSRSRRRLALAGIILSCVPLTFFAIAALAVILGWTLCAPSCL
jgi:hypothetical protein